MAYGGEMETWRDLLGAGIKKTKGMTQDNENNEGR